MCGINKIWLYINTIRYLKPVQIRHQIWRRLSGRQRERMRSQIVGSRARQVMPVKVMIPALDFDRAYLSRFPLEGLLKNEIEILHERHQIDLSGWEVLDASHLWNYNLHYLEFLIPLAVAYRETKKDQYFAKWCEYVGAWIEHPVKDSFEPYTISMRIPNLLICMNILQDRLRGTELERKLTGSIDHQYQYLLKTQELSLLANHYFENVKTILICSLLFGESERYREYFNKFCGQIKEQILSDGLHYERSIMYHKIILEDILRVYTALGGRDEAGKLLPVIRCMAEALASVSRGFQKTPLFNDAGDNVAKDTESLLRAVQDIAGGIIAGDTAVLEESGYYKLYAGGYALLFDCGQIGPSYMGGHAHCDCLSFALSKGGKALFTNSGTYQYQGRLRQFFRSTMAHNTVMIDEREQAELWGEHRAARRISEIRHKAGEQMVAGSFQSFCGDRFKRSIRLEEDFLEITDFIAAKDRQRHCARQFFHIDADYHYIRDKEQQICVSDGSRRLAVIRIPAGSRGLIHREGDICLCAQDFGQLGKKEVLEIRTPFEKSARIQIGIKLM